MTKLKNPFTNEVRSVQDSDAKFFLGSGWIYATDKEVEKKPVKAVEVKEEIKEEPKEDYGTKKKSKYESKYSSRD